MNTINHLFIAYSGGIDSEVLLHAISSLKQENPRLKITAIHVNHHLSKNAKKWVKHCEKTCKKLGIKLIIEEIDVKKAMQKGHSLEAVARELRYNVFKKILKKNDYLLTAHHLDDQAETLLLQLFRGAGPKGLSAMPEKMMLGGGFLLRPLLAVSRKELTKYAKQNNLTWIEDESNSDLKFDRNYIRHDIFPRIKKRWTGILEVLARSSSHFAEATELLEDLAELDLKKIAGIKPNTLSQKKLLKLTPARQNNVLRFWLHSLNFPTPSTIKLNEIKKNILESRIDASPKVTWTDTEIRRYRDDVYVMPPIPKLPSNLVLRWNDLKKPLILPSNLGTIHCENISVKLSSELKNKITIRFRSGAERVKLKNRKGSHTLKNLFQEIGIPSWQRNLIPLIYYEDDLIEILDDNFKNITSNILRPVKLSTLKIDKKSKSVIE